LVRVRSDDRITWAAGWLAGRFGASGRLAAAAVERAPRRIWTTTVIVAIAGAIAVSTRGATQNQVSTIAAKLALLADVDFFVQTVPADDLPAGPYCRRAGVRSWRPPPGSRRSWRASSPYATVGRQRVVLQGFGGPSDAPVYRLADAAAQALLLDGSWGGGVAARRIPAPCRRRGHAAAAHGSRRAAPPDRRRGGRGRHRGGRADREVAGSSRGLVWTTRRKLPRGNARTPAPARAAACGSGSRNSPIALHCQSTWSAARSLRSTEGADR
jgi:hypothetical protein